MFSVKTNTVHQPKSLYEISKFKARETYRFNWQIIINSLPKIIQRELLTDWLKCDEQLPSSEDEIDTILQFFSNRIVNWEHLSTEEFLHIMQHPDEVPDFAFEKNHCHLRFWTMTRPWDTTWKKRLCYACFVSESKFYKPYSANVWQEMGVIFNETKDHCIVDGDKLLSEFLWESRNWCERCICVPLFTIFDEDDCRMFFNMHMRKRTFNYYDSDYSSDDDSDIDYCYVKTIKGNFVDNTLYQFLKRNKDFDY
ncbi:hypothetical protein [Clinch densovirus 1]|uniref:Uncharacterized protein n=1 Tax=Clinch densovirus 1 TaxID=2767029 RepID=A0A7G8YXA8_9VIRU|nr:hypothetical protein QKU46_gp5 [Clinch densovirus 1]QNL09583.1 hypothetical protein [Clinch densovirus 1]